MAKQVKKDLTDFQKKVLFEGETEAPFTGEFYLKKEEGVYHCTNCDNPLFQTNEQYDAGCGWPSFTDPITPESVKYRDDYSLGMLRTEVLCAKCGAHLGHVFPDGPAPKGQRYCINSAVLDIKKANDK
jgi:peptide-methionine (R)-S-oxide reductase